MTTDRKPMVQLATLWERESAAGRRYFSGFLGGAQILLFDDGEHLHPTREGETVHVWKLLVQEREPARPTLAVLSGRRALSSVGQLPCWVWHETSRD
jgi:hypothetical protein